MASGVITRGDDVLRRQHPASLLLKDKDNDGDADDEKILSTGYGVRYSLLGHDLHGLRWGPDGRLYFSMGDRGAHVKTQGGQRHRSAGRGCGAPLRAGRLATSKSSPAGCATRRSSSSTSTATSSPATTTATTATPRAGSTSSKAATAAGASAISTCRRRDRPGRGWRRSSTCRSRTTRPRTSSRRSRTSPAGRADARITPASALPEKYNEHFFLTDFRAGPASLVHSFAMKPKGAGFELVDAGRTSSRDRRHGHRVRARRRHVHHRLERAVSRRADAGASSSQRRRAGEGPESPGNEEADHRRHVRSRFRGLITLSVSGHARPTSGTVRARSARRPESVAIFTDALKAPNPRMAHPRDLGTRSDRAQVSGALAPARAVKDKDDEVRRSMAKVLGESYFGTPALELIDLLKNCAAPRAFLRRRGAWETRTTRRGRPPFDCSCHEEQQPRSVLRIHASFVLLAHW